MNTKPSNKKFFKLEYKQRTIVFLKVLLVLLFLLSLLFLLYINIENFFYLKPFIKITIFLTFILTLIYYIIYLFKKFKPLYKKNNLLRKEHFLKELFVNTYQLLSLRNKRNYSTVLIDEAINKNVKVIDNSLKNNSSTKINSKKNFKFIIIFFFTLSLFALPFFVSSYRNAIYRISNIATEYKKPLNYSIKILNENLSVFKNQNLKILVEVSGDELPNNLFIKYDNLETKLQKQSNNLFFYEFSNITHSTKFNLFNEEYYSVDYLINLLEKPKILYYSIKATYPKYIENKTEIFENQKEITIPSGTNIEVSFISENTSYLTHKDKNGNLLNLDILKNLASFKKMFTNSEVLNIFANKDNFYDSLTINVNVINDAYPEIFVNFVQDSIYNNLIYINGNTKDDYGISSLFIYYSIFDKDNNETSKKIRIPLLNFNSILINEIVDLSKIENNLEIKKIKVFLEVFDNDVLNNFKKTVSPQFEINFKSDEEILMDRNIKSNENIDDLRKLILDTKKIENQLENLKKLNINDNEKNWNKTKKIESLKNHLNELKKKVDNINKNIENINEFEKNNNSNNNKKEIENDLKNNIKSEIEQMIKKIEDLLKNSSNFQNQIDNIKEKNEFVKENLTKNLEQYKNLEFDLKFESALNKLNDILQKQKELNNSKLDNNENYQKQSEINKSFESFKKEMEDLRKLNSQLETPNKLKNTENEENKISKKMNSVEKSISEKDTKSKTKQQELEKELEELNNELENSQEEMEKEKLGEDIESVRQILENLIYQSIKQEKVLKEFSKFKSIDPNINNIVKEQISINDNFEIIKDSLLSIAKRQPLVENTIFSEISTIIQYNQKISIAMFERNFSNINLFQKFSLTSTNNLALLLAESLKNMKEQQNNMKSNSKSGNKKCSKPGNNSSGNKSPKDKKGPNIEKIRKQQESLNKKIESKIKNSSKSQQSGMSNNEEIARMAAEQEMIRKQIQQILNDMKKNGESSNGTLEKIMKQMENTETDLVNKKMNQNTINRQNEITTRLLESEKAEFEREKDIKRKSNEGTNIYSNSDKYFEYLKLKKTKQEEILNKMPLSLKYYYKDKVSKYLLKIQ